jgi:DinB family protein
MQRSAAVEAVLGELQSSGVVEQIRELVEGASEAERHSRPAAGEWSMVEILRHLGDIEELRQIRFDLMLSQDNPLLTRPEPGPSERDSDDAMVLFSRWERLRARAIERLSAMSEAEWHRVGTQTPNPTGTRKDYSPTTILDQAGRIVEHGETHFGQIRDNLSAARG